jgi:hypothetical protein
VLFPPLPPEQLPVPVPLPVLLPLPVEPLPFSLVPPPPTGAAPPEADVTGMLVGVVDVGGVVVVVVVEDAGGVIVVVVVVVDVPVPPVLGTGGPVPTTARVAAGADPPPCGDGLAATSPDAGVGALPPVPREAPLDWLPVAVVPVPAGATGAVPAGVGAAVVGVVPRPGTGAPPEWAESTD